MTPATASGLDFPFRSHRNKSILAGLQGRHLLRRPEVTECRNLETSSVHKVPFCSSWQKEIKAPVIMPC